jgi:hypothetical protein
MTSDAESASLVFNDWHCEHVAVHALPQQERVTSHLAVHNTSTGDMEQAIFAECSHFGNFFCTGT